MTDGARMGINSGLRAILWRRAVKFVTTRLVLMQMSQDGPSKGGQVEVIMPIQEEEKRFEVGRYEGSGGFQLLCVSHGKSEVIPVGVP
jgi:hypothetical protein